MYCNASILQGFKRTSTPITQAKSSTILFDNESFGSTQSQVKTANGRKQESIKAYVTLTFNHVRSAANYN